MCLPAFQVKMVMGLNNSKFKQCYLKVKKKIQIDKETLSFIWFLWAKQFQCHIVQEIISILMYETSLSCNCSNLLQLMRLTTDGYVTAVWEQIPTNFPPAVSGKFLPYQWLHINVLDTMLCTRSPT